MSLFICYALHDVSSVAVSGLNENITLFCFSQQQTVSSVSSHLETAYSHEPQHNWIYFVWFHP